MRNDNMKVLYFENSIESKRLCQELTALIIQKKKYAGLEAINSYGRVYDEIVRVSEQLDRLWDEQVNLWFQINDK